MACLPVTSPEVGGGLRPQQVLPEGLRGEAGVRGHRGSGRPHPLPRPLTSGFTRSSSDTLSLIPGIAGRRSLGSENTAVISLPQLLCHSRPSPCLSPAIMVISLPHLRHAAPSASAHSRPAQAGSAYTRATGSSGTGSEPAWEGEGKARVRGPEIGSPALEGRGRNFRPRAGLNQKSVGGEKVQSFSEVGGAVQLWAGYPPQRPGFLHSPARLPRTGIWWGDFLLA